MSSYSIDTLEHLLYETTGQCDLVLRRIMGFLGGAEAVRIKGALTLEWQCEQCEPCDSDDEPWVDSDDFYLYHGDSDG